MEAVGLSAAQPWAATAGVDGCCKIWDIATGRLRHTCSNPANVPVTKMQWHPTEPMIFTASADGVVRSRKLWC